MSTLLAHERWPSSLFASRHDPRFSYCFHTPRDFAGSGQEHPLIIAVHGTGRTAMAYRDAFRPFCEEQRCVVLAPLFPIGVVRDDNPDGYKYILETGVRYDELLLAMVAEFEERLNSRFPRFFMFGFSGGAHFAHRFLYLRPERLEAVSIGAPGGVTLIDENADWAMGTRNFEALFGKSMDLAEIRRVPVHLVVGANDTKPFTRMAASPGYRGDQEKHGRNRLERLEALKANYQWHNFLVQHDVVPGATHCGHAIMPCVQQFFAGILANMRESMPGSPRPSVRRLEQGHD